MSPVDCQHSRQLVRLPGLVAMLAAGLEPTAAAWSAATAAAVAGGFSTLCAIAEGSDAGAAAFGAAAAGAVCDFVAVLAPEPAATPTGSASPLRRVKTRHRTASGSEGGGVSADDVLAAAAGMFVGPEVVAGGPTAVSALLKSAGSLLPRGGPICVDAGAHELGSMLMLGAVAGRPVHVLRVRTAEDLALVCSARAAGIAAVTCSAHVADLFESDEAGAPTAAAAVLWDHIADIDVAAVGGAVAELTAAAALLLTAVGDGRLSLAQFTALLCDNPRRIFGIEEGGGDSYIEVDLDAAWRLPESTGGGYAGRAVRGRVVRTVVGGELCYLDGSVHAKPGAGVLLAAEHAAAPPAPAAPAAEEDPGTPPEPGATTPPVLSWWSQRSADAATSSSARQLAGRHVLSVGGFDKELLHIIFNLASRFHNDEAGARGLLSGVVLATVFYEPSTRTACSFAAAAQRLGGSVIALSDMSSTSVKKGETLEDFVRTMACYADAIVLRHPESGAVQRAAAVSSKPLLNAGDGTGEHPTQALLDVFTIREELGTVNGLSVTLVGDLKHGRTVHSLARLLKLYKVQLNLVAPAGLEMPEEIVAELAAAGIVTAHFTAIEDIIAETDVLYVTRVQRERFGSDAEYAAFKGSYVVDTKLMAKAKARMIVLHPLPRIDEISTGVDTDPRAAYFRQMEYGVAIRMALLALVTDRA